MTEKDFKRKLLDIRKAVNQSWSVEVDSYLHGNSSLDFDLFRMLLMESRVSLNLMLRDPLKPEIKEKLSQIRMLLLDVDGVMTDAGMYYSEKGDEIKKFNSKDGMGIQEFKKMGGEVGLISSSTNQAIIRARAARLGIEKVYVGFAPKLEIADQWLKEMKISWSETAYIGDDINDIPILEKVAFGACPSDAAAIVKEKVHLVLENPGGKGAIREWVELLRYCRLA